MEDTLGLGTAAAAAVVSHRRDGALRWRCDESAEEAVHGGLGNEGRIARAQQRTVEVEDSDIVSNCGVHSAMRCSVCSSDSKIDLLRLNFTLAHPGFCRGSSMVAQFEDVFFALQAYLHNGALSIKAGV